MIHDLDEPNFATMQKTLAVKKGELKPFKFAILRNITIEAIDTPLRYYHEPLGLCVKCLFGEFNQAIQETLSGKGILAQKPDAILLALPLKSHHPILTDSFAGLADHEIDHHIESILLDWKTSIEGIRQHCPDSILFCLNHEPLLHPNLGLLDRDLPNGQNKVIERLNHSLYDIKGGNLQWIDMGRILSLVGEKDFYDWRTWSMGRMLYGQNTLLNISKVISQYLRPKLGFTKKCLVLDADNTLWRGIIDEDGTDGVIVDDSPRGDAYLRFQKAILNLKNRGILLALCSKNDLKQVCDTFNNHPGMVLKWTDFSAHRVNWHDKAKNIVSLAEELNLHLDSFVFVDDQFFEIESVHRQCPEVTCILLPTSNPSQYEHMLNSCGLFEQSSWTSEDRMKSTFYTEDQSRKKMMKGLTLKEYLLSLNIYAICRPSVKSELPRLAQLCGKTNRFNTSLSRYSQHDLRKLLASPEVTLHTLSVKDRVGDLGIVGLAILIHEKDIITIDSLLLSCRALGRDIEKAFLFYLIHQIPYQHIEVLYRPNPKNNLAKDFFSMIANNLLPHPSNNDLMVFNIDKNSIHNLSVPDHISLLSHDSDD